MRSAARSRARTSAAGRLAQTRSWDSGDTSPDECRLGKAVQYAALRDGDGVARTLSEIDTVSGGRKLYKVCPGFAAVARHVLPERFGWHGGVFDAVVRQNSLSQRRTYRRCTSPARVCP